MPKSFQRITLIVLTILFCASGSIVTHAQTSDEALHNAKLQLQQQQSIVNQKAQEQQSVNQEIEKIQQELQSLYSYISENKQKMADTQKKIDATNRLIEQKKEEIVALEDKISARNAVMEKRAVAMQQDDQVNMIINLFFESDSISEFIQKASAVSELLDADKDILQAQKDDLQQIENDKKEIDEQEKVLEDQQNALAKQQDELNQNLQKREQVLTQMQQKYNELAKEKAIAEQQKSGIESQMKSIQSEISQEQAAARARAKASQSRSSEASAAPAPAVKSGSSKEFYVTATAYSPDESGSITKLGYNIDRNPNMKLIAVDPSVIPLGKKVWVEGYGVAIAGDTGGNINGHRIDVLKPNTAQAKSWGRRVVKVIILN